MSNHVTQSFKYICVGHKININELKYKCIIFKLLIISFKMLLLFFIHLVKYSQRNVNMSMIIYFFFSLIFLLLFALCIFPLLLGI